MLNEPAKALRTSESSAALAAVLARTLPRLAQLAGSREVPVPTVDAHALGEQLDTLLARCERRYMTVPDAGPVTATGRFEGLKARFLRSVSHELRTPLASIEGFAMALLRDVEGGAGEMPAEMRRRFIEIIYKESRRLSELIEDVLDLNEIEEHPLNEDRQALPAEALFAAVRATFGKRYGAEVTQQIQVVLRPAAPGPQVYANEEALKDILRHLLDNAAKFGGGHPIELGAEALPGSGGVPQTRVWVRDQGPGIPAQEHVRIFNKFYRLDSDVHTLPGTGLGLAIVKTLVEQNDGRVRVESSPGQGATFSLEFPSGPPAA